MNDESTKNQEKTRFRFNEPGPGRPRLTEQRRQFQEQLHRLIPTALENLDEFLRSPNKKDRLWATDFCLDHALPHIREDHIDFEAQADPMPELTARDAQLLIDAIEAREKSRAPGTN